MKHKMAFLLVYAVMRLLSMLPFGVLFCLSDGLCLLARHVVRYRRKTVRANLLRSFPEKTERERREIERRFYHYICDYMVGEIKMLDMEAEEVRRRMTYEHADEFLDMIDKHGAVFLLIPHYGNFEWLTSVGILIRPTDLPVQVYKPLHNACFDELFLRMRSRFRGVSVPKHSTARTLLRLRKDGKHMAVGLITDQSPNVSEAHHWTTFLNQDTVFMDGAEKLAKLLDIPVFYSEIYHVKRGYCKVSLDLLTETPKATAPGEITELFARRVEATIRRDPPYWFWSHRRWKLKREDVMRANG